MSESYTPTKKAVKATIKLGDIPLDVYQLPDGSYQLYTESITDAIAQEKKDLLTFLKGKSEQALPFKEYNLIHAPTVEVEGEEIYIKPVPIRLATAYWFYRSIKGNKKAAAIVQACIAESIERRADKAFSIERTDTEYNKLFTETVEQILMENREEITERRLPGDDLYYPDGIN